MQEMNNLGILILLCLLANKKPINFDINEDEGESIEILDDYFRQTFLLPLGNSLRIEDTFTTRRTLSITNRQDLVKYVEDYAQKYKDGELIENNRTTPLSYSALKDKFVASINRDANSRRYLVEKLEYMPIILTMYVEDNNCIKGIDIGTEEDIPLEEKIYCPDLNMAVYTYLAVDVTSLLKKSKHSRKKPEKKSETTSEPSKIIQKFDDFLTNLVREGTYYFSKGEVVEAGITKNVKSFTTMFSRYKDEYEKYYPEFTHSEEEPATHAVIYNRPNNCYDIKRIDPKSKLYIGIKYYLSKE